MVKWSRQAKNDLRQIHDFIAQDSKYFAKKISKEIVLKSLLLNELPKFGKVVPEIGDENVRLISVHSYRIIYEIGPEQISILGIAHRRQLLDPKKIVRES